MQTNKTQNARISKSSYGETKKLNWLFKKLLQSVWMILLTNTVMQMVKLKMYKKFVATNVLRGFLG